MNETSVEKSTEEPASKGVDAAASGSRPRRRVRLELDLGADSRAKMADWLEDIAGQIRRGELNGDAVGGGYSVGYWLEITERPEITHESYFAALAAFNSANAEVRDRRAHAPENTTGANGGSLH